MKKKNIILTRENFKKLFSNENEGREYLENIISPNIKKKKVDVDLEVDLIYRQQGSQLFGYIFDQPGFFVVLTECETM